MHRPSPPARKLAALVAGVALAASACGGSGGPAPQAAAGPVELTVSLFGTFGYDEAGLFAEYEAAEPRRHDHVRVDAGRGQVLARPADPARLRAAASPTCRASRSPASPTSCTQPGRPVDRPARHRRAHGRHRPLHRLEGEGRHHHGRRGAGPRHRHRPDGRLLPQRPARPGRACPPTPPRSPRRCSTWDDFLALGEKFKAAAPAGTAWHDSAGGLYNAIISSQQEIYYDASGTAGLRRPTRPSSQAFDTAARAGQSGLTAKLEQFVDPGWDAGFASGSFATIACPSWMIGYIKGKAGDAGAGKWNVTTLPGGAGGNWGGSYLAIPAASQHKERGREADHLADRPRAAGEGVHERPATSRPPPAASTWSPARPTRTSADAPIGKIFSAAAAGRPGADPRPGGRRREERDDAGAARRRDQRRAARPTPGPRPQQKIQQPGRLSG